MVSNERHSLIGLPATLCLLTSSAWITFSARAALVLLPLSATSASGDTQQKKW